MNLNGLKVNVEQLYSRVFKMGSFYAIQFTEVYYILLKMESGFENCAIVFNTKIDTNISKILPVYTQNKEYLYLFGQNGIVLSIHFENFSQPILDAFESNIK